MIGGQFKQPRFQSPQSHFSIIPDVKIPRSVFNRTSQYKTTLDAGYIIPIFADEVLPGDSFKMRATTFARLATPITPFMDNLYADLHFFFVPNRLLWTNWEHFCGAKDDPSDSTTYVTPLVRSASSGADPWDAGTLFDYLGLPTEVTPSGGATNAVVAFHTRAYNLIYNTWYRDQNLIDSAVVDLDDGPDEEADYVLRKRGKRHDYFTSCLPWPQKGTAVPIPLSGNPTVYGVEAMSIPGGVSTNATRQFARYDTTTGALATNSVDLFRAAGANAIIQDASDAQNVFHGINVKSRNPVNNPYVDITATTLGTINQLREAFTLQQLYELDARGGTRYIEILRAHFGVTSPDFRLQRPEYLGGGTAMINTSPIPQTSATGATGTPQGNLAAMGTFAHSGIGFNHSFVEHGVILGLLSVRADLTYQAGLNKMWSRRSRVDYYWPTFAHLGEQVVYNKEILYKGNGSGSGKDEDVFGYQERYAEYRYKPSQITGQFRSNYATTLDYWHLAQDFGTTLPTLGQTFIEESPPISRIIEVTTEPHFLLDAVFDLKCARPMPVYSVPGLNRL